MIQNEVEGLTTAHVVYAVQRTNGMIKLGKSFSLKKRVSRLERIYGKLTILGVLHGYTELESAIQSQFATHAVRNQKFRNGVEVNPHQSYTEWFHPVPEILAYIHKNMTKPTDEQLRGARRAELNTPRAPKRVYKSHKRLRNKVASPQLTLVPKVNLDGLPEAFGRIYSATIIVAMQAALTQPVPPQAFVTINGGRYTAEDFYRETPVIGARVLPYRIQQETIEEAA